MRHVRVLVWYCEKGALYTEVRRSGALWPERPCICLHHRFRTLTQLTALMPRSLGTIGDGLCNATPRIGMQQEQVDKIGL